VFSTSSCNDLHQQWIKYSDNGKGVCIGIKRHILFEMLSLNKRDKLIYTYPIVYYDDDYRMHDTRIEKFEAIITESIRKLYHNNTSKNCDYNTELFSLILLFASLIKNDFHEAEQEWRYLVLTNTLDKQIESVIKNGDVQSVYTLMFAHKSNTQMGDNNFRDKYSFINDIKLGPNIINNDITINEIYRLVNHYADFSLDNISRSRGYIQ
jgi:hypothetical protein